MAGWQLLKLEKWVERGKIELGRGNVISRDDISSKPGPYPIYSSSAHNNGKFGEYAEFMFDEELITWSVDGGGNFFYRPKHRFSVTNVCGYMRIKPNDLNAAFVFYCLAEQHRHLAFDYTTKAHPSEIRKLYHLPEIELCIQQKIARVLQTIDQAIEKTEALIDKYQQIKAGLMHDLFTRGIGPNGQLRPPRDQAPELYHETPIGWIPKEWDYCPISNLSIGGLINGVFKEPSRVGDGVPLINVADLYKGDCIELRACERFLATQTEEARFAALGGDIFFTRSSLKLEGIAHANFLEWSSEPAVFECHVMRLRPDVRKVVPKILKEWCQGEYARRHFMAYAKQVTMTTISQDGIRGLLCPAIPHAEQERAVEVICSAERRLRSECLFVQKLYQKKAGLMHDLLTNKTEVQIKPEAGTEAVSA